MRELTVTRAKKKPDQPTPPPTPKLVKQCFLPLTGKRCVDMVITELCVLEMDAGKRRFVLTELAPGVTVDEVKRQTEAEIVVAASMKQVAA